MAQKITALRIVLASPSDVKRERQEFAKITEQVNNDTARPAGFHLELWRWETDSRPGFNPMGPQGLIDQVLKIEQCDLFVGIFWNRIGSKTKFGKTGTEHEFEAAYKAWKRKGSHEILFYFSEKPSNLVAAELAQRRRVWAFRDSFPEEGLYWTYKGYAEFVKYASDHLREFVHQYAARTRRGRASTSVSKAQPPNPENTFTLKVGRKGSIALPPELLQLLELSQGDQLEVRVVNNRIVSAIRIPQNRLLNQLTLNQVFDRLKSSGVSLTASELKAALGKGKRNG
jgi:bifunctional DNA-binding transcriptional regulator/antitoxin component of YhaV-PrlF toxin-antitoxin module